MLTLDQYQPTIRLGEPFVTDASIERDEYPHLVAELLEFFHREAGRNEALPSATAEQRHWLKALLTVRPPGPLDKSVWLRMDQLFDFEKLERIHVNA